jgi:hypothetical protein
MNVDVSESLRRGRIDARCADSSRAASATPTDLMDAIGRATFDAFWRRAHPLRASSQMAEDYEAAAPDGDR